MVAEVPGSEESFPQGYMLGHFEGFQFQGHETLALIVDFSSGGFMTYDISPICFTRNYLIKKMPFSLWREDRQALLVMSKVE